MSPSIVDRLTVSDVLRIAGKAPPNKAGFFLCPFHGDSVPSAHIVPGSGGKAFRCFSCGARGGLLHLAVALDLGNNRGQVARCLEERTR